MNKRRLHPLEISEAQEVFHMKLWEGTISEYPFDRFTGTLAGGTGVPVSSPPGFKFVQANTQFIDIGTGPTSVKSVSMWFKPDDIAGTDAILDLNGADAIAVAIGTLTLQGFGGATIYIDGVSGATAVTAGVWHHIGVTLATAKNADDFDIGRFDPLYTGGVISDVRLYSTVRTPAQIRDFYEQTRWRYGK